MTYKSMFNARSWLLEPLFFTVKLLRKLTGILELPGMFISIDACGFAIASSDAKGCPVV